MNKIPDIKDIREAHLKIKKYINHTPVLTSKTLNLLSGNDLFFKCENFQKSGAFKFRGATNCLLNNSGIDKVKGVITHSSGNHAGALSLASKNLGIRCNVIMPSDSSRVKIDAVREYGGIITLCEPTLEARESTMEKVRLETGATFIHPYDNFYIIAGQGTATLELLSEYNDLDYIIAPVGGGGLLSGTAIAAKEINSKIKVIAAEPEKANDAYKSFYSKQFVPSIKPDTIADGLRTSLGDLNYKIILKYVDDIVTVSEKEIVQSMRFVWERMKIIIEPSSAVVVAAILKEKERINNKKIGLIISGGNVDLSEFFSIFIKK